MVRGVAVAAIIGLVGAGASGLGFSTPVAGASGTTSTTSPGPAPDQSQIDATQTQVNTIESTLAQEEQQGSLLDGRYDTAIENQQNAESALAAVSAKLAQT